MFPNTATHLCLAGVLLLPFAAACTSDAPLSTAATYVRGVCDAGLEAAELFELADQTTDPEAQIEAVVAAFQTWSDSLDAIEAPEGVRDWHDGYVDRYDRMASGYATEGVAYRDRTPDLPPIPPIEDDRFLEEMRNAAANDDRCESDEAYLFGPLPDPPN